MTNHPNRNASFEITAYDNSGEWVRPWFIRIETGVLAWPDLTFPFQMAHAGQDEGQRIARSAARAALKAAKGYYQRDDTAIFSPTVWLLGPDQKTVHGMNAECGLNT